MKQIAKLSLVLSLLIINHAYSQTKSITLYGAVSQMNLMYLTNDVGDRAAIGYRGGVSYNYVLNPFWEVSHSLEYAQSGDNYIKFYPTGIIDTINVYKTINIYELRERLGLLRVKNVLRRLNLTNGPVQLYIGIGLYGGLLLSAHSFLHQLGGDNSFKMNDYNLRSKVYWGFEPEIGARVYLSDGRYFQISLLREYGVSGNTPNRQVNTTFRLAGTRAFSVQVSIPVFTLPH